MIKYLLRTSWCFIVICLAPLVAEEEPYDFVGYHLVASFMECDQSALVDLVGLEKALEEAVIASGAQILGSSKYVFPSNGLTMVFLLSESHASIHTYPEHAACFIDLFTCGHSCDATKFETVLEAYLHPKKVSRQLLLRGDHKS